MNNFAFQLSDAVIIKASGETAEIASRSESTFAEPQYLLRYRCADGRAVEQWWTQSALQPHQAADARVTDGCATAVTGLVAAAALPLTVSQALHGRLAGKERDLQNAESELQRLNEATTAAQRLCSTLHRDVSELRQVVSPA